MEPFLSFIFFDCAMCVCVLPSSVKFFHQWNSMGQHESREGRHDASGWTEPVPLETQSITEQHEDVFSRLKSSDTTTKFWYIWLIMAKHIHCRLKSYAVLFVVYSFVPEVKSFNGTTFIHGVHCSGARLRISEVISTPFLHRCTVAPNWTNNQRTYESYDAHVCHR